MRTARYNVLQLFRVDPTTLTPGMLDKIDVEGAVRSSVNIANAAFTGAVTSTRPPPAGFGTSTPVANLFNPENISGLVTNVSAAAAVDSHV